MAIQFLDTKNHTTMTSFERQEQIFKELFRLRMEAIEIPKQARKTGMSYTLMEKLLISELAKNKLLTAESKKELRNENWDF
jgi:hypothetical protein